MSQYHTPVLLDESVSALITNTQGIYADATFGGGGHTAAILSRLHASGKVIAFDRDMDAIEASPIRDSRLTLIHNNFRFIENYARQLGVQFDGVLADLGVSSHQFDTPERGFSFRFDAPLDMRMNTAASRTAADLLNDETPARLEQILRLYGEVDGAGRMARLIADARAKEPIRTSGQLDAAIASMLPNGAVRSLRPGGRLVVITYHSLEDRMVKNFIKCGNVAGEEEKDLYGRPLSPLEAVGRKPILPAEEEIAANTRARSAKLRVAEKKEKEEERA